MYLEITTRIDFTSLAPTVGSPWPDDHWLSPAVLVFLATTRLLTAATCWHKIPTLRYVELLHDERLVCDLEGTPDLPIVPNSRPPISDAIPDRCLIGGRAQCVIFHIFLRSASTIDH